MTKTLQGFVFIDAWGGALNNSGTAPSERTDNIVRTKILWREGKAYPYVSAQAWRYWWRTTLTEKIGWKLSPTTREKKIAYTEANPLEYPDDDMFGYMKAPKGSKNTRTRLSVLKNSILLSVGSQRPTEDFGTFSRQEGHPVPFEHEFYSTILKGIFSIDLDSAGVFLKSQRSGYQNLSQDFKVPEEFKKTTTTDENRIVLNKDIRQKRVVDVLKALPHLQGGAMEARHLTKVSPSIVVLAIFNSGSHMFNHLAQVKGKEACLNLESIKQIIEDYSDELDTKIYIGREEGFMDNVSEELLELAKAHPDKVVVSSVKKAVDGICSEIPKVVE